MYFPAITRGLQAARLQTMAFTACLLSVGIHSAATIEAAELRVPGEYKTIQQAIDAAKAGDTVLVGPGAYRRHIQLKPGVTLKSEGDDKKGKLGLARAEATIIDGGGRKTNQPGVEMAEGAVLDGFTVTGFGVYDDARWSEHHKTQGEHQKHEHIGNFGAPGIGANGVQCSITGNIVHHNGDTGIGIRGQKDRPCSAYVARNISYRNMGGGIGLMVHSAAIVEKNICFQNFFAGIGHNNSSPLVEANICYENIRAGIGVSEGASPTVRGNKCYRNRRAGIGVRTGADTKPLVEDNECYENLMAGIGVREEAEPIIRKNRCFENILAGIGCRTHAKPTIVENHCYRNKQSGIGSDSGAESTILRNLCYENGRSGIGQRGDAKTLLLGNECRNNKAVGIGFGECNSGVSSMINNKVIGNRQVAVGIHKGWTVRLTGNELSRKGGMPPIVMVFQGAEATFHDNVIRGGGVAGIRVQGSVVARGNRFEGTQLRKNGPPNFALWALKGSKIVFSNNQVKQWRHALYADQAEIVACENKIRQFSKTAIVIKNPSSPVRVIGNQAFSDNPRDKVLPTEKLEGLVSDNRLVPVEKATAAP